MKISKCILCGNEEDFNLNIYKMSPEDVDPVLYEARCECCDCNMSGKHVLPFYTREKAKESAIIDWNWRMEILFRSDSEPIDTIKE